MSDLKIVPVFFAAAGFFAIDGGLYAENLARMPACGLTMELPLGFFQVHANGDSLRAVTGSYPRWNLILYCTVNSFKTDRSEAVLSAYKQAGDYLRGRSDASLPGGYTAVVLRRTPAAQPVQRIEAFFSSRDMLYHFVIVPDERNVTSDQWKSMQQGLEASLKSIQIDGQEPAMSERAYTVRLVIFAVSLLLLLSGVLWLLLRGALRRKKR